MSEFNVLKNKRINGLLMGNDGLTIVFRTTEGKYYQFDTQNDCCNSVWFNHITGVDTLGKGTSFDVIRGALVIGVEDKGWSENRFDEDGHEAVQDGFWTLRTDRGYIDIEVRNSHNGYYGGSVVLNDDCNLQEIEDLREVFEDF